MKKTITTNSKPFQKAAGVQYPQGRARFQLEQEDEENVQNYNNQIFTDDVVWVNSREFSGRELEREGDGNS